MQDAYIAALAPFATSARTVSTPQYARVSAQRMCKPAAAATAAAVPVMAVASKPVLPANLEKARAVREHGQPMKAALARKAKEKNIAEHTYAFNRGKLQIS